MNINRWHTHKDGAVMLLMDLLWPWPLYQPDFLQYALHSTSTGQTTVQY